MRPDRGCGRILVGRFPRLRAPVLLWAALLTGIQVAVIAGKSITLSNVQAQREVARFLKEDAGGARLIMGSACLIQAVDYDPRYLDDRYLGVRSGKRADVIVTTEHLDEDLYGSMRQRLPLDWERIQQRLSEYHLVFEGPDYRVYFDAGFPSRAALQRYSNPIP